MKKRMIALLPVVVALTACSGLPTQMGGEKPAQLEQLQAPRRKMPTRIWSVAIAHLAHSPWMRIQDQTGTDALATTINLARRARFCACSSNRAIAS